MRHGHLVSAECSFDVQTNWDAYVSGVAPALERAGYETVSKGGDLVALAHHVPGDSYRLRIAPKGMGSGVRVTVRFSATPD